MGFYQRTVLPKLVELPMQQRPIQRYREQLVPLARGRVLEVGVGSGLNLLLYADGVDEVIGIDPSEPSLDLARRCAEKAKIPVDLRLGSGTDLPLDSERIDTLVMTWTLCSIPEPLAALREKRRVLESNGTLLFIEQGLSPEPGVALATLPDTAVAPVAISIERSTIWFERQVSTSPSSRLNIQSGPRPMTYMYEGHAVPSGT